MLGVCTLVSTRTFRRALTASVDSCAEIKSTPSVTKSGRVWRKGRLACAQTVVRLEQPATPPYSSSVVWSTLPSFSHIKFWNMALFPSFPKVWTFSPTHPYHVWKFPFSLTHGNKFIPFCRHLEHSSLFLSVSHKKVGTFPTSFTHTQYLEHTLFITRWGKEVNENDVHDLFSSECNEKWQTVLSANNIKNDSRQPNRIYPNSQTQNKDVKTMAAISRHEETIKTGD